MESSSAIKNNYINKTNLTKPDQRHAFMERIMQPNVWLVKKKKKSLHKNHKNKQRQNKQQCKKNDKN